MTYPCDITKRCLKEFLVRWMAIGIALLMLSNTVLLISSKFTEKKSEKIELEEGGKKDSLEKDDFNVENVFSDVFQINFEKYSCSISPKDVTWGFNKVSTLFFRSLPKYLLYHSILI